ncbi:hypothetical protein ACSBR2_042590 [Camellia fascicularis]
MEYFSLVDTSLDLNANPLRHIDEVPDNKEIQSTFLELGRKISAKEENRALMEELNRVSAENKKLTGMLTVLCENYNALRSQLIDYVSKNPVAEQVVVGKKRKADSTATATATATANGGGANGGGNSESSSSDEDSCKKPKGEHVKAKISRVYVRTEANETSLIVKDGYQWRKYGQKVTRDNPSPRAYFKCSFAPSCPVKKKVQRSIEDQSVLVATYEGEHNHPHPSRVEPSPSSNRCVTLGGSAAPFPASLSSSLSGPTITLDLTKSKPDPDSKNSNQAMNSPEFQQFFVEQMASSLTKDPSFKAALAAAISGRFLQQNQTEKL